MKETKTLTMEITFREPEEGEEANWLGWFDNEENNYTLYAHDLDFMNQLLHPKTVNELEKEGYGKCCKIIYEKNGERVKNKLKGVSNEKR